MHGLTGSRASNSPRFSAPRLGTNPGQRCGAGFGRAVVPGFGRAVGDTLIPLMLAGNATQVSGGPGKSIHGPKICP